MRPLVISLPDDVRDRLEQVLAPLEQKRFVAPTFTAENALRYEAAQRVCDVIFPSPETEGSAKLRDALLGMQTGDGRPAIELKNLPPTQGRLFYESLVRILDDRMDRWLIDERGYHPHETAIYKFHHDEDNFPEHKLIRSLYCLEPGKDPVPTVFVTLDEAIDAHAAMEAQRTGGDAAPIREEFIGKLKASPTLTLDENPNYTPTNGAPHYFTISRLSAHIPSEEDRQLHAELLAAYESLRARAAQESTANLDANTALFWNNSLVAHDRAEEAGIDRWLNTCNTHPYYPRETDYPAIDHPRPDVQKQWNARTAKAVGAPMARVDSVVRDGRSVPADNAKIAP